MKRETNRVLSPPLLVGILVWFVASVAASQGPGPKTRIAVIEFKVDNAIGIDNAGQVIAEWIVSEFVRLGKYEVQERLSIRQVLEEQGFQQSEAVTESTAVKVGRIRGVEGIVTGSVIKLGNTISVTGRIIAVESGRVLRSSVVRASGLDALPKEIEVLANELCDVSRAEFEIKRDIEVRRSGYVAIGGGLSLGTSSNSGVFDDQSSVGLGLCVSYTGQRLSGWLQGIPLGGIKSLHLGLAFDVDQFWGIAVEGGFLSDDALDYVAVTYAAAGLKMQPRHELVFKVMFGGSLSGTLWLWDNSHPLGAKEKVDGHFELIPPATFSVEALWRAQGGYTFLLKVVQTSLNGYTLKHVDLLGNAYEGRVFFLTVQKEFAITY